LLLRCRTVVARVFSHLFAAAAATFPYLIGNIGAVDDCPNFSSRVESTVFRV
jgi:hypothetical protein